MVKKIAGIVQFSLSHCIYFPGLFIKKKNRQVRENKKKWETYSAKKRNKTKKQERKIILCIYYYDFIICSRQP